MKKEKAIDPKIIIFSAIILILVLVIVFLLFIINKPGKSVLLNNKNDYAKGTKTNVTNDINSKENNSENSKINTNEQTNSSNIPAKEESKAPVNNNTGVSNDSKTITYFENVEKDVNSYVNSNNIDKLKTVAKDKFTTLVDFIFYGTTINGVTFNQLTETTKQKLVAIVNSIDTKIESKVPGYKDTIKAKATETYAFLSGKLKQGITIIGDKVEEKIGSDTYNSVKDQASKAVDNIKESASTIAEGGKEVATKAKDKISNWYEGWK